MADYSVRFRTLAAMAGWDESFFCPGLHSRIRSELAWRGEPMGLQELIYAAIRLDNVRQNVIPERAARRLVFIPREAVAMWRASLSQAQLTGPPLWRAVAPESEAMEVGGTRLGPQEHRTRERRCYCCGDESHLVRNRPVLPKDSAYPSERGGW